MIQLLNISLAFGGQRVLRGVTWTISDGERIGLVGPNGAGKTTLLRVISGQQAPDEGTVSRGGSTTVGYLEQDVQEGKSGRTVLEETMRAFDEVLALQAEEADLLRALDADDDHESEAYAKRLESLGRVQAILATREAHRIRPQAEAVLTGLGFDPDTLDRPLHTFSGGWRMRVALAQILLRRPSVLLLDEPTNHLDIDSIDWLETYLKNYPGTVVLVSHDRYFLDRMVTTTAELAAGKVTEYSGNYTYYLEARKERRALQQAAYDNQQREIAEMERFVERFRAKATKAKQAQSRVKALERMERLEPPPSEENAISFRFPEPARSGRTALELSRFSKSYFTEEGELVVFDDAGPLSIERGAKVALIGKNGAGKSTLARILGGSEPFDGTRTLGHNVELTYFAQHQADSLPPNLNVLEALREAARGHSDTELRSILGAFLFTGDDVLKSVSVLSGGERSRVALAKTLLVPANLLLLDEPTNHLDIASINVLVEALRQFTGTFVVVSHDRHFLDQVVNQVWRVEDGGVRVFHGNYSDYLWQIQHGTAARLTANGGNGSTTSSTAASTAPASSGPKTKEQKRLEAEARNRAYRDKEEVTKASPAGRSPHQVRKQYEKIERRILERETRQSELEATLADPDLYADPDRARTVTVEYDALKTELADLYRQWERLAEQLVVA